jgi:hypothetical protein
VKWEDAIRLSKVDVAVRFSDAPWPEPTRIVKRRAYVAFNHNTAGDAGEWSTCPWKNVYDHTDWLPHNPIDAVTALGSVAPESDDAPSSGTGGVADSLCVEPRRPSE